MTATFSGLFRYGLRSTFKASDVAINDAQSDEGSVVFWRKLPQRLSIKNCSRANSSLRAFYLACSFSGDGGLLLDGDLYTAFRWSPKTPNFVRMSKNWPLVINVSFWTAYPSHTWSRWSTFRSNFSVSSYWVIGASCFLSVSSLAFTSRFKVATLCRTRLLLKSR